MHRWCILNASLTLTDITLDVFPYVPLVGKMWERAMNFQWLSCITKTKIFSSGSKVQRVKRNHLLGTIAQGAGEFWGGFYLYQKIITLGCKFGHCGQHRLSNPHVDKLFVVVLLTSMTQYCGFSTLRAAYVEGQKALGAPFIVVILPQGPFSLRFAGVGKVRKAKSFLW